jgi:hypothetical protein
VRQSSDENNSISGKSSIGGCGTSGGIPNSEHAISGRRIASGDNFLNIIYSVADCQGGRARSQHIPLNYISDFQDRWRLQCCDLSVFGEQTAASQAYYPLDLWNNPSWRIGGSTGNKSS